MKGFKQIGKGIQSGHTFPTSAGFTSSSGKTQVVGPYTRRVHKYAEGGQAKVVPPRGSPGVGGAIKDFVKSVSNAAAPKVLKDRKAIIDKATSGYADGGSVGNAVVKRYEPIIESDKEYGGKGPLLPGYAKGGKMPRGLKKGAFPHGRGFKSKPMIGD